MPRHPFYSRITAGYEPYNPYGPPAAIRNALRTNLGFNIANYVQRSIMDYLEAPAVEGPQSDTRVVGPPSMFYRSYRRRAFGTRSRFGGFRSRFSGYRRRRFVRRRGLFL